MHIAVAGNIGAGKTTLTKLLAKHYGWETHFEDVEQNPYLNDFYEDMQRWSFNLQIYYLNSRFTQIQEIQETDKNVIQDRTIYEDAFIFAPNPHSMGLMTTRDFENYFSLFNLMDSFVSSPDLLIYLRASVPTLVNQIQQRGRDYEESIRLDYLKRLNERYEAWISQYEHGKLLVIDIDDINFAENPEHLKSLIRPRMVSRLIWRFPSTQKLPTNSISLVGYLAVFPTDQSEPAQTKNYPMNTEKEMANA
jgi:deoxyadenosine/deoxycytidine kinase